MTGSLVGVDIYLRPVTEDDRLNHGEIEAHGATELFVQQVVLGQSEENDRQQITLENYNKAKRFLIEADLLAPLKSRQAVATAIAIARHIARGTSLFDITTDTKQGDSAC